MAFEKVVLPVYTKTEEILNSVSHGIGVLLGIVFLILGIIKSTVGNNLAGAIVFGVSSILLYTCSMLYHSLKAGNIKKAMRLIDHSAIFVMITGSATAINLIAVYPFNRIFSVSVAVMSIVLSILGIALTFIDQEKYMKVQMRLYIVVGVASGVMAYPIFKYNEFSWLSVFLVIGGGIVYLIGMAIYKIGKKKKYYHSVFHLFVLAGSCMHFAALYINLT
ncbi:MAG: hemolysin III family protein [Clostridia bacterium]|nr:hemolysin III family protein [Clostridia bacterium]